MRARVLSIIEVGFLPGRTGGEGSDLLGDLDDSESQARQSRGRGCCHLEKVFLSESDQDGRRCNPYRVKDGFGDETQGSARGGCLPSVSLALSVTTHMAGPICSS